MSNADALIQDLVIANRILAREEVVDAYGHVSVRHPDNPNRFLIARSLAPELVGPADIIELDLDAQPVRDGQPASRKCEIVIPPPSMNTTDNPRSPSAVRIAETSILSPTQPRRRPSPTCGSLIASPS
jgi:hypothetical protein